MLNHFQKSQGIRLVLLGHWRWQMLLRVFVIFKGLLDLPFCFQGSCRIWLTFGNQLSKGAYPCSSIIWELSNCHRPWTLQQSQKFSLLQANPTIFFSHSNIFASVFIFALSKTTSYSSVLVIQWSFWCFSFKTFLLYVLQHALNKPSKSQGLYQFIL